MSAYVRVHRLAPVWAMCVISVVVCVATAGIVHAGKWDLVAGAPLLAIFFYGVAIAWVNRLRVVVDRTGARVTNGPLPAMPSIDPVPCQDVAKVYVRHASMPSRSGSIAYLAAGLQTVDGRWVDLSEPLIPDPQVWDEAACIARALAWPGGVEELWGRPPRADWKAARGAWCWTAAVVAGFVWGAIVETWLRR